MNAHICLIVAFLFAGCSAAPRSQGCSDKAYLALATECSAAAVRCRAQGGTEAECGTVCDAKADEWEAKCQ